MFEPYVDEEYLKVAEYIRTNKDAREKLKKFVHRVKDATTIRVPALLAEIKVDLKKIQEQIPEILDTKKTIEFLDRNLKPVSVLDCLDAIKKEEIHTGDIVRVKASQVIKGPPLFDKGERKIYPLLGSFLEYNPKLNTVLIRSEEYLQAEMIEIPGEERRRRYILRTLFKNVGKAESFFKKYPQNQYSEVFGMLENIPTYPCKIEDTQAVGELSSGIIVALLRVQIEPQEVAIQPLIRTTEIPIRSSSSVRVETSTTTSGTTSIGTFSSPIIYHPCIKCPRCGYEYVPFIVPTRCPMCGFESEY